MERNRSLLEYIGQIFTIFGATIVVMNIFCLFFGESAREYSSMFSLGSGGLSIATTAQFFLLSAIIVGLSFLFFSDRIIRKLSLGMRIVCIIFSVFLAIVVFVILFDWFPIQEWQPWVGFLLSFGCGFAVSATVAICREKAENAKMERALQRYKKEKSENE